jgi:hypothetical protein
LRISRLLARHDIKSVGLPPKKIPSFLQPVKDDLGLKTPDVYSVPCECGKVYIGQTGHSVEARVRKHIRLGLPRKSAFAEHRFNMGHHIQLGGTSFLSSKTGYMERIIREDIEMELHPDNFNREDGLHLSRYWKPLIHTLRGLRE